MAIGDLELPEDEAERQRLEEQRQAFAGLCALMKEVLGDKVEKACAPLDTPAKHTCGLDKVESRLSASARRKKVQKTSCPVSLAGQLKYCLWSPCRAHAHKHAAEHM